jgi:hypothetical protein
MDLGPMTIRDAETHEGATVDPRTTMAAAGTPPTGPITIEQEGGDRRDRRLTSDEEKRLLDTALQKMNMDDSRD